MTFPLYQRPGTVAFLDDDPAYLEMLADVMPADWPIKLFIDPMDCITSLRQQYPRWETDTWRQQEMIERSRNGQSLIQQILRYWAEDGTQRFELTRVLVVDYSMPAINGMQALSRLSEWPGSRILLTGQADERVAVTAFNQGLIEQFIPKQSSDVTRRLADSIKRFLTFPVPSQNQMWRSTLTQEQYALLSSPVTARLLSALIQKQRWVEYVVIGAPFGVLGLDAAGQVAWLQLEHRDRLDDLAELAWSQGMFAPEVKDIRYGRKLVDLELQIALNSNNPARLVPAVPLGEDLPLLTAVFPLDLQISSGSYAAYLASQANRSVSEVLAIGA